MASTRRVIISGGSGALGAQLVRLFAEQKWWTCCIDRSANQAASHNVAVEDTDVFLKQAESVISKVQESLNGQKADAIVCVAGGWTGGNAADEGFLKACNTTWQQSVWTSVVAARMAALYLKEGGLLVLTGAAAALKPTAEMVAYGMAKAAVHHMATSLGKEAGGLPRGASAVCILPVILDTPANRAAMPKAKFSNWTPMDFLAGEIYKWAQSDGDRPASGSLLRVVTRGGQTNIINVAESD